MRVRVALVLAGIAATTSSPVDAGRTHYGWLYGTDVLPERGAEIQSWIEERNDWTDAELRETSLWWSGVVGVTDRFELGFPFELEWLRSEAPGADASFTLARYGVDARYRFCDIDLDQPDGIAPLVRLAAMRDVGVRDAAVLEADLVASYQSGAFRASIDLGFVATVRREDRAFQFRPGAGVSIEVVDDFAVGGELYGELPLASDLKDQRWIGVGPNVAWTHGRFWISASLLIGLYQIDSAPRVVWGILF